MYNPLKLALADPTNSLLNNVADEVALAEVDSKLVQDTIDQMLQMSAGKGHSKEDSRQMVGLAAPQLGVSKCIITIDLHADGSNKEQHLQVIINPKITHSSKTTVPGREGCWSCGNICGNVERAKEVTLEGLDRKGKPIKLTLSGFVARIAQHETDHLKGVRFPDRISVDKPEHLHWVEPAEFEDYRRNWMHWEKLCPRETWEAMNNPNVTIGKGNLAGKGVYGARNFEKGELVVPYNLKELTQEEFDALPDGEWEWTHTFYGKIYHFPEPERYVNHSDNPSTYPTSGKGDIALRPIKKGEAITINDKIEFQRELDTFLEAYEEAANSRDFNKVSPFIADDATFWFTNGQFSGKLAIQKAFEDTWKNIQDETYTITDVKWVAATYWASTCTYKFKSDGIVNSKRQVYEGHGTNVVKRIAGRWRIVHEHLSK